MANICSNAIFCKNKETFVKIMAFVDKSKINFEMIVPEPKTTKELLKEVMDVADDIDDYYSENYSLKNLWRRYYWGAAYNNDADCKDFGDGHQFITFETPWTPPTGIVKALWDMGCDFDFYYNNEYDAKIHSLRMNTSIEMESFEVEDRDVINTMATLFDCSYWLEENDE